MADADSKPKPSSSLADRISQPASSLNAASASFTPSTTAAALDSQPIISWADEVASPVAELSNTLESAQIDGYVEPLGGSALHEPEYEVEVKLSDIQGDTNSPLFSLQTFEQLGM